MSERIEKLFKAGKINVDGVRNAVIKKFITAADFEKITGEKYDEP